MRVDHLLLERDHLDRVRVRGALADGSKIVSGFVGNRFDARGSDPATRARFQVTPKPIIEDRAEYQRFLGNEFLARIAAESGSTEVQRLPDDAGSVRFQGNSALRLAGRLMTEAPGRGASADVSSFSDIHISAGSSSSGSPGTVVLSAAKLSDWKVESLLVGGVRNRLPDGTTTIDSRTSNIVVDNRGGALKAIDLNLVSDGSLTIADRASLVARGAEGFQGTSVALEGGGTFARISADPLATISRSSVTAGGAESLTIGGGARLKGPAVLLDSTSAMSLAPDIRLLTDSVSIASGAISIVAGDPAAAAGAPGLQLEGLTLENIFQSDHVALRSYGAIDLYGSGVIGDSGLSSLTLSAGSIRGLDRSDGSFVIRAREILLDNKLASAASAAPAVSDGSLTLRANRITLGENDIAVTGFDVLGFRARDLLEGSGTGSLVIEGNLRANAPLITGAAGADLSVTASGTMFLTSDVREISRTDSLGASLAFTAGSIVSDANFSLPSGDLTLTATRGDIDLGGSLSVDGTAKEFNKSIRFTHAGGIHLVSETGDVLLREGALVSASGDARGGNAGQIDISAANGAFRSSAEVSGTATKGFEQGSFRLDVKSVTDSGPGSLAALNAGLDKGGFTNSRAFRIREGDVAIDHLVTSHEFSLAADTGSILVTGRIDASGTTGGSISLSAHGDLVLAGGSSLTVRASEFDSAGKGGSILLEAGTQIDGVANESAVLALSSGSSIDLSVDDFVAGDYRTPGSSAFEGKFTGTLHLRAPRDAGNTDFGLASLDSAITGASSILAEGFKVYQPNNGVLNTSLRSQINNDNKSYLGSAGTLGANETAMRSRLLANNAGLDSILVLAPGVEIVNPSGDLTLGLANINGSTSSEARSTADWDLSSFRYGSMSAPGVLTMRASGDLVFNNTLSDGFDPVKTGFLLTATEAGNSSMWLATLSTIKDSLPVNTQSWSYRLTAGADTAASDFRAVRPEDELGGKGSVLVGELYPAVPNGNTSGTSAALGLNGLTSNTIRISTNSTDRGNRFEVIRTGTGSISVNAGRDIQLRNQFSTIYTAGVALPDPTRVFEADDFVIPIVPTSKRFHPGQSGPGGLNLGAIQQLYQPVWSMAGGNLDLHAGHDIGRFTMQNGTLVADSSRQMPTNWLYRRGYLDSSTGRFSNNAGIDGFPFSITDPAASTTWWIDYSNFFQGFGTLGGGNIDMSAGNDMVNADAVAPTNARMAGQRRNPAFGTTGQPEFLTLAPDAANLVELGGGDITVTSGRNIDGGIYYVERGHGTLDAGGSITTNAARTPSRGMLANEDPLDPLAWMPTTLFVGKSSFDVVAKQDVLLGPVSNPFLLPQGQNNKYWYKTYFSTLAADAGATVSAYGGDVTHRNAIALPTGGGSVSMLSAWFDRQNLYTGAGSFLKSSNYQPWIRLAETGLGTFGEVFTLHAPNLDSTSFQGFIHLVGNITLAPSETGGLNLAAAGGIIGLNPTGPSVVNGTSIDLWTYSTLNVSDASPSSVPGFLSPLAYQSLIGRDQTTAVSSAADILGVVGNALTETGSFTGDAGTAVGKNLRHGDSIL
ncbi:MAG: hypothetical protein KDN05_07785, partial [Verrucomicrobiae bacterium]|nr:hypothetical protein [Verrucomicrobiae bacterium]